MISGGSQFVRARVLRVVDEFRRNLRQEKRFLVAEISIIEFPPF